PSRTDRQSWRLPPTMTVAPVLPSQSEQGGVREARLLLGLALTSFAGLLLELALTRLFSVVLFYHFAFLAISLALLGLGAGAVFACLRREWLLRWPTRKVAAVAMALASVVWSYNRSCSRAGAGIAVLLLILIAVNSRHPLFDIVYAKGNRRDAVGLEYARSNAISRVEVDRGRDGSRYIVIDADASTAIMNVDPHHWEGTAPWLMAAAPAICNLLRPHG